MEIKDTFVFQVDSPVVNEVYENHPNYLIEYQEKAPKEYCVLYFSSNNIYYPNTEGVFRKEILQKNRFEWYGNRIGYAYKHIFLRDIQKQWYLSGVNHAANTPEKLLDFLKKETEGLKIIALGSSAGGFASVIFGQLLGAERIYTFNGQFEIISLLKSSDCHTDPLLFRNNNNQELLPFYNAKPFIKNPATIYYFHSNGSAWDKEQLQFVEDSGINVISFRTSHHGIPFLKSNLSVILNLQAESLRQLSGKKFHPILFSVKLVGLKKTVRELNTLFFMVIKKLYSRYIPNSKKL